MNPALSSPRVANLTKVKGPSTEGTVPDWVKTAVAFVILVPCIFVGLLQPFFVHESAEEQFRNRGPV